MLTPLENIGQLALAGTAGEEPEIRYAFYTAAAATAAAVFYVTSTVGPIGMPRRTQSKEINQNISVRTVVQLSRTTRIAVIHEKRTGTPFQSFGFLSVIRR